jgi:uncharacterized membrane protein YhaH (DUF805 family)
MVDKVFMSMGQLFFNDEGVISRRQWWLGTIVLTLAYLGAGVLARRWLGAKGLDEAALLFMSIAILIPFHAVNTKRFRAIGRAPELALVGGLVSAAALLADHFLEIDALNIGLGWAMIMVIVWYVTDLGLYDHEAHASAGRIDAAIKRS